VQVRTSPGQFPGRIHNYSVASAHNTDQRALGQDCTATHTSALRDMFGFPGMAGDDRCGRFPSHGLDVFFPLTVAALVLLAADDLTPAFVKLIFHRFLALFVLTLFELIVIFGSRGNDLRAQFE